MAKLFNNKDSPGKINHKNAKKILSNRPHRVLRALPDFQTLDGPACELKSKRRFALRIAVYGICGIAEYVVVSSPCILPSHTIKNIFNIFGQEPTYSKEKIKKNHSMNDSLQKMPKSYFQSQFLMSKINGI